MTKRLTREEIALSFTNSGLKTLSDSVENNKNSEPQEKVDVEKKTSSRSPKASKTAAKSTTVVKETSSEKKEKTKIKSITLPESLITRVNIRIADEKRANPLKVCNFSSVIRDALEFYLK